MQGACKLHSLPSQREPAEKRLNKRIQFGRRCTAAAGNPFHCRGWAHRSTALPSEIKALSTQCSLLSTALSITLFSFQMPPVLRHLAVPREERCSNSDPAVCTEDGSGAGRPHRSPANTTCSAQLIQLKSKEIPTGDCDVFVARLQQSKQRAQSKSLCSGKTSLRITFHVLRMSA